MFKKIQHIQKISCYIYALQKSAVIYALQKSAVIYTLQIVIYALQKSVKLFYVQKLLSKLCPLAVTSTIRRCPTTVQKTRKTTNMVVFKVYQY